MKVSKCLYCSSNKLTDLTYRLDGVHILKCSDCGLMMVAEISDDTKNLYTSDYFEKKQGTKSGYSSYLSSPVGNLIGKYAFVKLLAKDSGDLLDLGCADGSLLEVFKNDGYNVSGLEISNDAVVIANQKDLNVSVSNLHTFPKNQKKSDIVTAFDLLEHVDKLKPLLESIYNNLNEDGLFCFSTLLITEADNTDYWFNNSLEHYIYFDSNNLNKVLTDVFGKGNFDFTAVEINGISEVWGFAKKGKVTTEAKVLNAIKNSSFDKKNPDNGYLLSLLYNQMSRFDISSKIIDYFNENWSLSILAQAKFYHNFYQGKLEKAVSESKDVNYLIPANSIYWQSLCDAERRYYEIYIADIVKESTNEIVNLREQLFITKDKLNALLNSRVVGRIIKARNLITRQVPRIKSLPKKTLGKSKAVLAKFLPENIRKPVMRLIRSSLKPQPPKLIIMDIEKWETCAPLVSVIIPYYNRADTIDETLMSLTDQTFQDFEVIIVNDGSPNKDSVEKLEDIRNKYPTFKIINQKNQGVAAARNNGVKQSNGRYIVCLDSDDILNPTFIEKMTILLEANPDISLATSYMETFGVKAGEFNHVPYDPIDLYKNNMVITASEYKKEAWEVSGGYKSKLGYEDWEFWINLAENGFWGKQIPEKLFKYRIAMQSRYIEDKDVHWDNIKKIHNLHPKFKQKVRSLINSRKAINVASKETALVNLSEKSQYKLSDNQNKNILIAIPWMTFGGAETLVLNFCNQIKDQYNIHFVTGLKSKNEWEYKFKEISNNIYHLPNLLDRDELYLEFVSNYISTRNIDILHIVHTDFIFSMLPELKKRHANLRVVVTMFNDRVPNYFQPSIDLASYIDEYTSDNLSTINHYNELLPADSKTRVIPNGIDCLDVFNQISYNRTVERENLKLDKDDLAVFFVGRLSEEKNPDIFLDSAESILKNNQNTNIKFFIIGDGPMRSVIEKKVKAIGNNVAYLGYQSEVARYLSAADIFVLPSSIEGFPLSILEAMAMRVVVIASNVGAVSDVLTDGQDGYIIKPGSVADISKNILNLSKDRNLLEKNKLAARSKLESKYSSSILRDNYLKLYKDVSK